MKGVSGEAEEEEVAVGAERREIGRRQPGRGVARVGAEGQRAVRLAQVADVETEGGSRLAQVEAQGSGGQVWPVREQ